MEEDNQLVYMWDDKDYFIWYLNNRNLQVYKILWYSWRIFNIFTKIRIFWDNLCRKCFYSRPIKKYISEFVTIIYISIFNVISDFLIVKRKDVFQTKLWISGIEKENEFFLV